MSTQTGIIVSFFSYTLFVLLVGVYFYRHSKGGLSKYFLGGRNVNPWVTALSAQASDMSAWLFMSLPAVACLFGYQAMWIALGLAVGTYLNWRIVARRLRSFSVIFGDAITVPQYIQNRFNSTSPSIRVVCSSIIVIFFLLYVASGFSAEAKLFEEIFGLNYRWGLFIGAGTILFYTFVGGFLAVCWTDFYQGILMFFALLIVPIILLGKISPDDVSTLFSKDYIFSTLRGPQTDVRWGEIVSGLSWGLGYFGMPHILVRFMAIRSEGEIRKSRIIAVTWVLLMLTAAVLIGLMGASYLGGHGVVYTNQTEAEKIFMRLTYTLFNPWIGGILLSAILAAVMSTVSSQLLVLGSAMTSDLYSLVRPSCSLRESMLVGRLSIVLITLLSLAIAWSPESSVMGFVSYAWSGFAATFAPIMLLSLVWKRMTFSGALWGLITGAVSVIVWESLGLYALTGLSATLPGFCLASTSIILISLLTQQEVGADILRKFDLAATKTARTHGRTI